MTFNIEIGANIKYTDETGTYHLFVGDKIICCVGEQEYNGTLSRIGAYKESADSEPQHVIYIDTWKDRMNMSRKMIMLKDITEIYKNPFYGNERTDSDERDILDIWVKRGYNKTQAKAICDRLSDMTKFYCIPYIKATNHAIEAVRQVNASDKKDAKEIINEIAKQCVEEAEREYFELVDIYFKVIEQCDRDAACLTDTLEIASKCWNDLMEQKMGH